MIDILGLASIVREVYILNKSMQVMRVMQISLSVSTTDTHRHSLVYGSTPGMYLSVYLPSTWALSLFTNIKDNSVSFISFFFFFSFSHVKLRILYCQVLCASFLNELCNEPKSDAWGILRVDFFF